MTMISAIGSNIGISSIAASYKAGIPAMDASLNEGKTQGMDRAVQREKALTATVDNAPVRVGDIQAAGPAREAAKDRALGRGDHSAQSLAAQFLVMASSHAPGPKSISNLMAEDNYRAARSVIVAPAGEASL